MKVPTTGGTPTLVVTDQRYAQGLIADSSGIYWGANANIVRLTSDGTVKTYQVGSTLAWAALDDTAIDWTANGGDILKYIKY